MADPLIILGPWKRKENSWFADNGDPGPLVRNKKTKMASNATQQHVPNAQHRHPSIQGSEASNDTNMTRQMSSQNMNGTTEHGDEDSHENRDKNVIDVDDVDDPVEESADDELGECLIKITPNQLVLPPKT